MKNIFSNKWTKPGALAGLIMILALLPLVNGSPYLLHVLILTFVYTMAAISFRTITISGQFPLAHGAFMGIGAYTAAIMSRSLAMPAWVTIPSGAVLAGLIGIIFGYPFARLRTLYYAMGSLFFGVAVTYVIQSLKFTGGYVGLTSIQPIFNTLSRIPSYYFFLALTVLCAAALYRFEFSRIGTNLKAVAQSYTLASSVGINEVRYRVLAVATGCFFAGMAGAAFAHYNGIVTPTSFNLGATLWLANYVLIGGLGSFAGPIIGTPILYFIPQYYFSSLKAYSPFIPAVILIIIAYLMPKGLAGLVFLLKDKLMGKMKGRKPEKEDKEAVADAAGD